MTDMYVYQQEPPPEKPGPRGWLWELISTFLPAVLVVLAVNLFLAQPRTVHGESMEPNLHENQRLILDLISYRFRPPVRGEIVVINLSGNQADPLIKRVVGLPGEVVEIREGAVYVDGVRLEEPYLDQMTSGSMDAQLVPEGSVFVLGDNRGQSNDSRYFGMIPYESILGRAWLRYWPPQEIGLLQ